MLTRHKIRHGSDAWFAARAKRITSSVAAAALGEDENMTPLEAWLAITGRDDFDGNKATMRGTRLEGAVLDYPTRGGHLKRIDAPLVSRGTWAADSTDCLYRTQDGGLLTGEGKTVSHGVADQWGDEGTDQVPGKVIIQCQWHMAHWPGTPMCIVPVLVGGYAFEFREYVVKRNEDMISMLIEELERWHRDYVENDVPPPAVAGDNKALERVWACHEPGKWIPGTPDVEAAAREYVRLREVEKAAKTDKENAGAKLRQMLGTAEGSKGDGWSVTWKHQKGALVTDWKAIAEERGATDADIQRHTANRPGFRVLRANLMKARPKKGKTS